jgi:hypothetical protein
MPVPVKRRKSGEAKERRKQHKHPKCARPQLLAKAPNQVLVLEFNEAQGTIKHPSANLKSLSMKEKTESCQKNESIEIPQKDG